MADADMKAAAEADLAYNHASRSSSCESAHAYPLPARRARFVWFPC